MTVSLGRLVEINPATPEFDKLAEDEEITFMPLEACWPDGRADTARTAVVATVSTGYTRFRRGDILLPKITPTFEAGRVFPVLSTTEVGAGTTELHVLRPLGGVDSRFISYVCRSRPFLREGHASLQGVGNLRRVTVDFIRLFPVLQVDEASQCAIADYLDRETAQIDALIAKQEQLIETLRERRATVVERTVFMGLEAAAETSENNLEWLPSRSPSHWIVTQLGNRARTLAGYAFPSEGFSQDSAKTRLLRGINIKPGRLDWSETVYWDQASNKVPETFNVAQGDLVLGLDRPFVSGGVRVATVLESDLPALLLQRVMLLRSGSAVEQRFLARLLSTRAFLSYLEPLFTGVSVPHMSEWQVQKFRAPFPPLDEQGAIADFLDEEVSRIDDLTTKAQHLIVLAQERRAALITAAVTGHIDVRGAA